VASRGGQDDEQVHLVTSAHQAHSEEMSGRARRYLWSMGIRTVCLVLAIFVLQGWSRMLAIVAAIVLPWFAVVLANAGPVGDDEQPEFIVPGHLEIEAGTDRELADGGADGRTASAADNESTSREDESTSEKIAAHGRGTD
jgi:hypothetical protein